MKRIFKNTLIILLLVVGTLTGCAPECSHEGGLATCTSLAVCEKCGKEYGELDVENHNFVAGEIITAPTCTADGTQVYNCECGETKTETIVASGHSYKSEWSHDEDGHWHECECGDRKDSAAHEFKEGEITKVSTCTEAGKQNYVCECGEVEERDLQKLSHIDANLDAYCDREGCNGKVWQPYDTELPISYIIAAVNANMGFNDGNFYVRGTVKEIHDHNNGILTITDGTNDLYINIIKGEDGTSYGKLAQKTVVGDIIRLYGKVKKDTSKNIPSLYGSTMEIVEHTHTYGSATCTKSAQCPCGGVTGEPLGHLDANQDTICERCGIDTTLTFKYLALATESGMDNETLVGFPTWTDGDIYFRIGKGNGTTIYLAETDHIRLYKNNNFTVFCNAKYAIYKITYHLIATSSADSVTKFSNIFKSSGHTTVIEGTSVTIDIAGVVNVPFINTTGSTVKLVGITVAYK